MRIRKAVFITLMLALATALLSVTAQADYEARNWAELQAQINEAADGDTIYIPNYVDGITADPDDGMLVVTGNKSITLDLNGKTLDRNRTATDKDGHVIIVYEGSTLTIKDSSGDNSGRITGGWATNGGAINNQGTLIIEGGTFTGNKADNGGAICNRSSLTIMGGVFENNTASVCGGAIWSESTAEIENAEIKNNTGGDGGAIYLTEAANCTLKNVQINSNQTTEHGGGGITNYGTLTLSYCEVKNNTATGSGGGIFNGKTLNADNTVLSGNASGDLGGGVCNYGSSNENMRIATANLSNCTISGNTANDGGGIYNCDDLMGEISVTPILLSHLGKVTVSGNTYIEDNNSLVHGGGGIRNGGLLQMKDNINVKNNTCAGNGSGIWNSSVLEMQGSINVCDNNSNDEPLSNNVYLTAGKKITLTGALTGNIGITSEIANAVLTSGYSTYHSGDDPEDHFFSNEGYVIRVNDGELRARLAQAVNYYDPIDKEYKNKEECLVVDSTATRWENDWYVVTGSVWIDSRVYVSGSVNLILTNGAELVVPKGIEVPFEANFTVWGQIEGYTAEYSEEDFDKAGDLYTYAPLDDTGHPDENNAGIGADMNGNIIINGGKIHALGGRYAPGIGISSMRYNDETGITVNNGFIWATGGEKSAGIGGGYGGTCPKLEINDGVVIGMGAGDAAGIGGGYFGYYFPITIRGGEVYGYGSPWTAGIGIGCTDGEYAGILASEVGGGLIDIQGGKVVANCDGHDKNHPDCGALVNSEHRDCLTGFKFHGGVSVYPEAKVTYVRENISDVTSHPELQIVFRGTASNFTKDELSERAGIMMSSNWVFIEVCDHPGATYTVSSLTPTLGHVMHCTACDMDEKVEPHTYDSNGKCTVCGYTGTNYTISFGSNEGTGEMNSESVVPGSAYTLPACGFTAPEGKIFAGWLIGNSTEPKGAGYKITVTENITLTAKWEEIPAKPEFKTQSLVLSGQIGANFYMDLDCENDTQKADSYMIFTINGKTQRADFDPNQMNQDRLYYGFTCKVNSVQMADTITAEYHYKDADGIEQTVEKTYTVEQYLNTVTEAYGEKAYALIKAINDYGYYAQRYLSANAKTPWTLGTDHVAMKTVYTNNYSEQDLAEYAIQRELKEEDIEKVTYSLSLDADTAVNLYIKPVEGYNGKVTAKLDNGTKLDVVETDGRYKVTIPDISAHLLGKMYEVKITTESGESTVKVSALSYAYAVMKMNNNDSQVKVMSALYDYYLKALEYKNQ